MVIPGIIACLSSLTVITSAHLNMDCNIEEQWAKARNGTIVADPDIVGIGVSLIAFVKPGKD